MYFHDHANAIAVNIQFHAGGGGALQIWTWLVELVSLESTLSELELEYQSQCSNLDRVFVWNQD
jgi:hypothetical protein